MRSAASLRSCISPASLKTPFASPTRTRAGRAIALPGEDSSRGALGNLKLFGLTYAAGFVAVSLFLA